MKPLLLSMQAFGPFAGAEVIDFSLLGENSLFLINGPTGAGKTTLLDAISYALFGKTTGAERQGEQMRCHHAKATTVTEIDFIFAIGENTYRVQRRPAQQRPKKRGEGMTDEVATATLWRLNPGVPPSFDSDEASLQLLASRKVRSVTQHVEQLIGLQADQFRQVVVLPQGKFRELLTADASQREEIFSQLFQTSRYLVIEEKLKEAAREIRLQTNQYRQNLETLFAEADVSSEQQLVEQVAQLEHQVDELLEKNKVTSATLQQATQQQQQAEQLQQQFAQRSEMQRQQQQLQQQQAAIESKRQRLAQARQAQALTPLVERQAWLLNESQRIAKNIEQAKERSQQLATEQQRIDNAEQQLQPVLKENEQRQQQLQQLERWLPKIDSFNQLQQQLEQVRQQLSTLEQQSQQQQDKKSQLQQSNHQLQQQLQQLEQQINQQPQLEILQQQLDHERQRTVQKAELKQSLNRTQQRLVSLEQQLASVQQQVDQAAKHSSSLEHRWYQQQALNLATTLQQHEPCPVCGSREHPQPATIKDEVLVEHKQLAEARHAYQLEVKQQQALEQEIVKFKGELAFTNQQLNALAETQTETQLQQQQANLDEQQQRQQQQRQQQHQWQQNLQAQTQQITDCEQQIKQLSRQLQEQQINQAKLNERLSALEKDIPQTFRNVDHVTQTIQTLRDQIKQVQQQQEQLAEQRQQMLQASAATSAKCDDLVSQQSAVSQQLKQLKAELDDQLTVHGFSTLAAYQEACLSGDDYRLIEQQVNDYQQQKISVDSVLADLNNRLKEAQPPNLEQLQQRYADAQQHDQQAHQAWLDKRDALNGLNNILKRVKNSKKQAEILEKRYAVKGTLADVASGQNAQRLSLHRFVLSVLLDDVLAVASQRLEKMTQGRYQLLRASHVQDARSAGGLTILVADAYTGQQRSTKTLSGGEGFMAALALALGLSDVVQSYAGGIRLDTLFIDEGFGSLDDEALDVAINTLAELRASGRTIGIISHVRELKDRLQDQVNVIRERDGSRIEMRTQ